MSNYNEWDLDDQQEEEEYWDNNPYINTEPSDYMEEELSDGEWQEYWKEAIENYEKLLKEDNDKIWKRELKRRLEIAKKELFILQNK